MPKSSRKQLKLLSIVCPVYNEEGNVLEFYHRLKEVLTVNKIKFELLFINDGSKDNTLLVLYKLADEDKEVKVINLSKNFGQQAAIAAGLEHVYGEAVVIIDADLQDPPELIVKLLAKWQEGFEVVSAKRRTRQDSFFKKFTAAIFYKVLNVLISSKIPENVGEFRLLDAKAVRVLRKLTEKDRYLRGLSNWIGFKQTYVLFDRDKRFAGKTNYSISKMVGLALNAIFSFSRLPMRIATYSGLALMLVAIIIAIYAVYSNFTGAVVPGWTSQVLIFSIFNAIELLVLGIISEYVGRIYTQVQDRPMFIISDTTNIKNT